MVKKKNPPELPAKAAQKTPASFTAKQGQYLAYLYLYRKLHRCSPAESEIAAYFRVSPPSVHQMIVKLEELGLITREPGMAQVRSGDGAAQRDPEGNQAGREEPTAVHG